MNKTKVALVTREPVDVRLAALKKIAAKKDLLEFVSADVLQDPNEVITKCSGAEVLITVNIDPVNAIASKLPALKLLQTFSAGTDRLDKAGLLRRGTKVANNGGANSVAVAEHTIMLILTINHKFGEQIESVKKGNWATGISGPLSDATSLVGKQVGIIGLGRIGSRVAKRLAAWECTVVYFDTENFDRAYEESAGARRLSLEELVSTSDYISLHVPLDRVTHHMFSTEQFKAMKKDAVLINTCRGSVVDEPALIKALRNQDIWGAGLDVTEVEPISPSNPLLTMPNVVITPHQATRVIQSEWNADINAVENAERIALNLEPYWVVDPV